MTTTAPPPMSAGLAALRSLPPGWHLIVTTVALPRPKWNHWRLWLVTTKPGSSSGTPMRLEIPELGWEPAGYVRIALMPNMAVRELVSEAGLLAFSEPRYFRPFFMGETECHPTLPPSDISASIPELGSGA